MKSLTTLLFGLGALGLASAASAAAFTDVDSNGDGAITAAEFTAVYPDVGQDVWLTIDANADGVLTEDEHAAAIEAGLLPAG